MQPALAFTLTSGLLTYAWYRQSLTTAGLVVASLVATAHAYHFWNVFYALLAVFFLSGTFVTKIKHAKKSTLTTSSTGGTLSPQTPHPRTSIQVLANSLPATTLILIHAVCMRHRMTHGPSSLLLPPPNRNTFPPACWNQPYPAAVHVPPTALSVQTFANLAPYGVVAAYATAAADTFASELGILASTKPVFLPSLLIGRLRRVPPGTNGGVTLEGVAASALGAFVVAFATVGFTPLCGDGDGVMERRAAYLNGHPPGRVESLDLGWTRTSTAFFVMAITIWGTLGALLDSLLGAWCQASVVEVRTGRVVEGEGGSKVLFTTSAKTGTAKSDDPSEHKESRLLLTGRDWLSNNGVNLVTGLVMSFGAMAVVAYCPGLSRLG